MGVVKLYNEDGFIGVFSSGGLAARYLFDEYTDSRAIRVGHCARTGYKIYNSKFGGCISVSHGRNDEIPKGDKYFVSANHVQPDKGKMRVVIGRAGGAINDDYFSELNIENCQWGGYIASDGCLHGKNGVRLLCKEADKAILEMAKKDLLIDNNIIHFLQSEVNGWRPPAVSIYFSSEKIISDLEKHFNITKRKSFTLQPPNICDQKLKLAYMVGLINGDGAIFRDKARNGLTFNIAGTKEICEWCRELYNELYPLKYRYIYKNGSVFSFAIHNKTTKHFLNILNNLDCFHLARKWDVLSSPDVTVSGKERGTYF